MSIINKIIGGGGGSGLSEAQVDARVVAVAPTVATSRTYDTGAINNNAVWTFDFGQDVRASNVIVNSTGGAREGIFAIRAQATPHCVSIASTGIDVTTGVLTGTTGVEGNVTLSTHSDNKLYLENRLGGTARFTVTINSYVTGGTPSG